MLQSISEKISIQSPVLLLLIFISGFLHALDQGVNEISLWDLSRMVSEETGLTIIISPKIREEYEAKIYIGGDEEDINEIDLYNLYLSILDLYSYAAVKNGNTLRVVRSREIRKMPVPVVGPES